MRSAPSSVSPSHARNIREGMKGPFFWRENLDAVAAIMSDRKKRDDNLELFEKLGGLK